MPVETSAIISQLEERERKEGTLPQLLQFYQKLLRIQSRIEQKLAPLLEPGLSSEAINERIERGCPLIKFDELALNWPLPRDAFNQVTAIFTEYSEFFGVPAGRLRELEAGRLLSEEVVKAWYEGTELPPAISEDADKHFLTSVIHATLKPFLISHARTLTGSINQERWRRSYCPICGGSPDFAFLDKERGSRWLLCSRCDTEWLFQRLRCPYCDNQDQNALAYFTDDKGLYRLYVCERCKHYLKAIDLRQTEAEVLLPLERLYTLDLDRQAREQGYSPCDKATGAREGRSS